LLAGPLANAAADGKSAPLDATPAKAGTDAYGDPLPPGAVGRLGSVRFRHGATISYLAYSADGKKLASFGHDEFFRVWEASTGKKLWEVDSPYERWQAPAFFPNGKAVALVQEEGRVIRVLAVSTGKELWSKGLPKPDKGDTSNGDSD